jgi:hypothetical protein
MLAMHATASMYPTVSDRDVLSIPFVMPPKEVSDEVVNSIRSSMAMIEKAQQEIRNAIGRMESFVSEVSGQEPG